MNARVPLHQLSKAGTPLTPLVDCLHLTFAALPQAGSDQPFPDCVPPNFDAQHLTDVLGCECRTKVAALFTAQFLDRTPLQVTARLAVGGSSAKPMDYRYIAQLLQTRHQPPYLTLAQLQMLGRLLLRDLPPADLMQDLEPVPLPLAHRQPVLSHPDPSLSRGHFYFALTGHSQDLPHFRCSLGWKILPIREYSGSEQSETGASIHLTLDGLEAVDLALDLAAAPCGLDSGNDGLKIPPKAICKSH